MRIRRPRFHLRHLMIVVAILALAMGWMVHARDVLRENGDQDRGVLFHEATGLMTLTAFLVAGFRVAPWYAAMTFTRPCCGARKRGHWSSGPASRVSTR